VQADVRHGAFAGTISALTLCSCEGRTASPLRGSCSALQLQLCPESKGRVAAVVRHYDKCTISCARPGPRVARTRLLRGVSVCCLPRTCVQCLLSAVEADVADIRRHCKLDQERGKKVLIKIFTVVQVSRDSKFQAQSYDWNELGCTWSYPGCTESGLGCTRVMTGRSQEDRVATSSVPPHPSGPLVLQTLCEAQALLIGCRN
jgi:hypothetical protein